MAATSSIATAISSGPCPFFCVLFSISSILFVPMIVFGIIVKLRQHYVKRGKTREKRKETENCFSAPSSYYFLLIP